MEIGGPALSASGVAALCSDGRQAKFDCGDVKRAARSALMGGVLGQPEQSGSTSWEAEVGRRLDAAELCVTAEHKRPELEASMLPEPLRLALAIFFNGVSPTRTTSASTFFILANCVLCQYLIFVGPAPYDFTPGTHLASSVLLEHTVLVGTWGL
jgi:hypothetical protein